MLAFQFHQQWWMADPDLELMAGGCITCPASFYGLSFLPLSPKIRGVGGRGRVSPSPKSATDQIISLDTTITDYFITVANPHHQPS